jgi:Protein of unknown function (DUF3379)
VTCDEARVLIGADPETVSAELQEHLNGCAACREYREQMLALNAKIRKALQVRATPRAPDALGEASKVTPLRPRAARLTRPTRVSRSLRVGVSLAAGLLVAFTLWLSRPQPSLAAEVVAHVEGEPDSWSRRQPVSAADLEGVLRKSGVRLGPGMQPVVYANSCWFRGHFVPHIVVMTEAGPATVIILMHERVPTRQTFQEDGYTGLLVPARGGGSVAVVSRTPMALDEPASDVLHALEAAST